MKTDDQEIQEKKIATPEEKLFRLISAANQNDAELQRLIKKYTSSSRKGGALRILHPMLDPLSALREGLDRLRLQMIKSLGVFSIPLPAFQFMGFVVIGILCFYVLSGIEMGRIFYLRPEARLGEVGIVQAANLFPKFFEPAASLQTPKTELVPEPLLAPQTASVAIPIPEELPGFKLVGISQDERGKVAMIEPASDPRARFVRNGDVLPDSVQVIEVKDYSVILGMGEKKWEIS